MLEQLVFALILLIAGYVFGSLAESRHFASLQRREEALQNLPAVTCRTVDHTTGRISRVTLVQGSAVISLDYFKRITASLRNLVGGRVGSYETLLDRARREAILRMKESAGDADIIINLRIETSAIGQSADSRRAIGSIEAMAYGTAVSYTTAPTP